MSLPQQPLKLINPGLVLAPIAIAAERSFGILGQLISPPAGEDRDGCCDCRRSEKEVCWTQARLLLIS